MLITHVYDVAGLSAPPPHHPIDHITNIYQRDVADVTADSATTSVRLDREGDKRRSQVVLLIDHL